MLTAHDGKANELRGEAARATREAAAALCLAVRVAAACCGSSALTRIDSAVDTDTILWANDAIHLRNQDPSHLREAARATAALIVAAVALCIAVCVAAAARRRTEPWLLTADLAV